MRRIVVLTGSGISAESGIATFRDTGGVWAKYDFREVATSEGFAANPDLVHEFYNLRRYGLRAVEPNPAHFALAKLERELKVIGGLLTLVTQNVDDLHERSGSQNVLHMHGELLKSRCGDCEETFDQTDNLSVETKCMSCGAIGAIRPDVVWFGEIPRHMGETLTAIEKADLFVSIGTSGAVYPAAGFVAAARRAGAACIELNLEPSENACLFTDSRYGMAGEIVPLWVDETLAGFA